MQSKLSTLQFIIAASILLMTNNMLAEEIWIDTKMAVKNSKGELIKGAYVFPGQVVTGERTAGGISITTPNGQYLLVQDNDDKGSVAINSDVIISEYEQLGNLKSFPVLKITSVDKNKQILINLYQYLRSTSGEKFKHLLYAYIMRPQSAQARFSFKNKLNPKYIFLDRFSSSVWGGTDVELVLEVAIWDDKLSTICGQKSIKFEVISD